MTWKVRWKRVRRGKEKVFLAVFKVFLEEVAVGCFFFWDVDLVLNVVSIVGVRF